MTFFEFYLFEVFLSFILEINIIVGRWPIFGICLLMPWSRALNIHLDYFPAKVSRLGRWRWNPLQKWKQKLLRTLDTLTVFENNQTSRIWILEFCHFPTIFVLLKMTCLITLFDHKQFWMRLLKWFSNTVYTPDFLFTCLYSVWK